MDSNEHEEEIVQHAPNGIASKQSNKQTSKRASKQTSKQASKQTNEQLQAMYPSVPSMEMIFGATKSKTLSSTSVQSDLAGELVVDIFSVY